MELRGRFDAPNAALAGAARLRGARFLSLAAARQVVLILAVAVSFVVLSASLPVHSAFGSHRHRPRTRSRLHVHMTVKPSFSAGRVARISVQRSRRDASSTAPRPGRRRQFAPPACAAAAVQDPAQRQQDFGAMSSGMSCRDTGAILESGSLLIGNTPMVRAMLLALVAGCAQRDAKYRYSSDDPSKAHISALLASNAACITHPNGP